jgi:phenylalanine-4-hydroxylase
MPIPDPYPPKEKNALLHRAAAADPALPHRPDWTIDQGWAAYSEAEHATWRQLFQRQSALLPGRACKAFIDGMRRLPIGADRIPDFEQLSSALTQRTGWQIVAVPGLVPDEVFFDHLAHRRFPAGRFIRTPEQLDYLEEPDVFHDVFGHVPMLMNPVIADFVQAYGVGGLRAQALGVLPQLARVYWYTVEFGLVQEHGGVRIYGSGIASSAAETVFAVENSSPNRIAFELQRVMRTHYRIDDFQESYFVIDNLEQLLALARIDFGPMYEDIKGKPEFQPGDVVSTDRLVSRGTGRYHHL